jgi:alanyl-tRNA synthetase
MKKFWDDPFVFSFEAKIQDIQTENDRIGLVFDGTYFYPEGGGQPSDKGKIASFPVIDVQERETDDLIFHYLTRNNETEKFFSKGMMVPCEIDQEYRIHNMRVHTTCHLLFGAARKMFKDVHYAGFNIGEVGNLYLETTRQIRAEDLREMATLANEVVIEDHPITAFFVDTEKAKTMKELAFNIELPRGQVRIIDIDGWDVAACSGTHMHRTLEIGPIKVLARESHKKNVTRIDYAIGKRAVAEMGREEKILGETAEFLSTSKDQLSPVVKKISADLQSAQKDLRKMREKLVDYRVQDLQTGGEMVNGVRLVVEAIDYLDASSVKVMASKLLANASSLVVGIIGGTEDVSVAVGCSQDLNLQLSQPVVEIAKKYGGGGGGRPTFVTAGAIKAGSMTVRDEIKKVLVQLLQG